ncbi:MAG: TusE/DsrC/DsvC family sulfur relay protein [Gammaproteobacteria bacterium]|jgi:TusE/DsrC/DsvC family sulfur relay protein
MADIKKVIKNPNLETADHIDHQLDLEDWSETRGHEIASQEGVEMTNEHWAVIHKLRDYYLKHGLANNGRELGDMLDTEYADLGGRKYLRRLFPDGPVAQGMRIAGLPVPPHTENTGFGTKR